MKLLEKIKNLRRPSSAERSLGKAGYPQTREGLPDLEYLAELTIAQNGLDKFRKMKTNDPIVGGLIIQLESIMRNLSWEIEGKNAVFFRDMLNNLPGGVLWLNYYMASAFTYGFFIGEEIYKLENSKLILKDIAPRFQPSIKEIDNKDGMIVQDILGQGVFEIPYKKTTHHYFFSEARSPFGMSILRHLYKPYYYKVSIEASETVSMDRDLSGMPMMTAPEGFDFTKTDPNHPEYDEDTEATLNWALEVVSNVRKDNLAGIVKPYGWEFEIIRGENRTSIHTNDIISRYNTEMAAGVLENFLSLGAFATTNNANTEVNVNNFLRACNGFATVMEDTYNNLISRVARYNSMDPPKMKFSKVDRDSLESLATFFSRLSSNGVITPTTTLEKELMKQADFTYDPNNPKEVKPKN